MKWGPQPKPRCGRPDCNKDARMYGYCMNHGVLLDRNGTPYTQDEVVGMREANRQAQEMDAALAADGPVIEWVLDKRRRVMVAASVYDPHAEQGPARRTAAEQERLRAKNEQQRQRRLLQRRAEAQTGTDIQVEYVECTDPGLLAAARTQI